MQNLPLIKLFFWLGLKRKKKGSQNPSLQQTLALPLPNQQARWRCGRRGRARGLRPLGPGPECRRLTFLLLDLALSQGTGQLTPALQGVERKDLRPMRFPREEKRTPRDRGVDWGSSCLTECQTGARKGCLLALECCQCRFP